MFARFPWFGFQEKLRRVSLGFLVLNGPAIQGRHVIAFLLEVGVQQRLIAFPTTPKDMIQAPQFVVHVLLERTHIEQRGNVVETEGFAN